MIRYTWELSVFTLFSIVCCPWGCTPGEDGDVAVAARFVLLVGVRVGLRFLVLEVRGIEDSFFFVLLRIGVVLSFLALGTGVGGLLLFAVFGRGVALLFCCLGLLFIGVVVLRLALFFFRG